MHDVNICIFKIDTYFCQKPPSNGFYFYKQTASTILTIFVSKMELSVSLRLNIC